MTTDIIKIPGKIIGVSRRRFLNVTAGAIATTGAALIPQESMASDTPMSLQQLAHALHESVGRFSDRNAEFLPATALSDSTRVDALDWAMERLRHASVDEIQSVLKTAIGGAS